MFKSGEATVIIDPFNKFNIYSFLLLTSYSASVILLKACSFNDVNSGKLYILDLLKGSVRLIFVTAIENLQILAFHQSAALLRSPYLV